MKPKKYRIKKIYGRYRIQIYGYEESGILWWRKKDWKWHNTNIWGGIANTYPLFDPISKSFKTLKAAKKQIKKWKQPIKYFEVN